MLKLYPQLLLVIGYCNALAVLALQQKCVILHGIRSKCASMHSDIAVVCLQELLTELQDQDQYGKRGEAWTFAQVAAIVLVLLPPFQLVVRSSSRS
jgi:hypothetical protein